MKPDIKYAGCEVQPAAALAAAGSKLLSRPEAIIKVSDLAYILFNKPDLETQQRFLNDFGMALSEKSDKAIYMRGSGTSPWMYAAYKANKPGYIGLGFNAASLADLQKLSNTVGVAIDAVDGPGGGQRVRLHDPDGFVVDVVYGREQVARLTTRDALLPTNTPFAKPRINQAIRSPIEAAAIERIGHCVLAASDFETSMQWYLKHLGLIPTDVQCLPDGSPALAFNRLDLGDEPADHHSLVIMQNLEAGYMHSAYETLDIEAVGMGHQHLRAQGWQHFWGIGRHILGSQIFDYWLDPDGHELEHYADGDVFDASFETRYHLLDMGGLWAWGDDVPKAMRKGPSLILVLRTVLKVMKGKFRKEVLLGLKEAMSLPARPWL